MLEGGWSRVQPFMGAGVHLYFLELLIYMLGPKKKVPVVKAHSHKRTCYEYRANESLVRQVSVIVGANSNIYTSFQNRPFIYTCPGSGSVLVILFVNGPFYLKSPFEEAPNFILHILYYCAKRVKEKQPTSHVRELLYPKF